MIADVDGGIWQETERHRGFDVSHYVCGPCFFSAILDGLAETDQQAKCQRYEEYMHGTGDVAEASRRLFLRNELRQAGTFRVIVLEKASQIYCCLHQHPLYSPGG